MSIRCLTQVTFPKTGAAVRPTLFMVSNNSALCSALKCKIPKFSSVTTEVGILTSTLLMFTLLLSKKKVGVALLNSLKGFKSVIFAPALIKTDCSVIYW